MGYNCEELVAKIREILGTDKEWPVVLVGCGNLGQALLGYGGFANQGFSVKAAFDISVDLVGTEIGGIPVFHLSKLTEFVVKENIQMAILAVPAQNANQALDQIVQSGITGILNFAPVTLSAPKSISVVEVDLAM